MASKTQASAVLFLALNLLFFAMASGCGSCLPTPKAPKTLPPPSPPPCTPPPSSAKCPTNTLKLGACVDVLGGLINLGLGKPPKEPCCSMLQGLGDLEAAVCLCTVLKANVLGLINLNMPINLSLLLNYCGKNTPTGFTCP